VGQVIELSDWREARERDPVARLERAIARLEAQLEGGSGRIGRRVEAELLAITGAMTAGLQDEAAELLGVSLSTVKRRWQAARLRLMAAFEGEPLF